MIFVSGALSNFTISLPFLDRFGISGRVRCRTGTSAPANERRFGDFEFLGDALKADPLGAERDELLVCFDIIHSRRFHLYTAFFGTPWPEWLGGSDETNQAAP